MKALIFLILILNQQSKQQEETKIKGRALLLPDVSVIGDIVNETGLGKKIQNNFSLREFEFAFQSFLFPDIRADVFVAFHGPEIGETSNTHNGENHHIGPEVEEAYVSFLNIGYGFSGKLGRRYTEFGKFNPLHSEQWPYVDPPKVIKDVFGTANLIGDGGQIEFLTPLPFVLRLQGGVWRKFEGTFGDVFYTGRIFSSIGIGDSEISLGASYAGGKSYVVFKNIVGSDISYLFVRGYTKILFILEPIGEIKEKETSFRGLYSSLFYSQRRFQFGVRLDLTQKNSELHSEQANIDEQHEQGHTHEHEGNKEQGSEKLELGISPVFSFLLTETTKIRLQWNFLPQSNVKHVVLFQFLFGMGPHAHVLQF